MPFSTTGGIEKGFSELSESFINVSSWDFMACIVGFPLPKMGGAYTFAFVVGMETTSLYLRFWYVFFQSSAFPSRFLCAGCPGPMVLVFVLTVQVSVHSFWYPHGFPLLKDTVHSVQNLSSV